MVCFSRAPDRARFRVSVAIVATALFVFGVNIHRASAALIDFQTPAGSSTGGQNVSAKATFTTSNGHLTVLLENLQGDPRSAVQCLSGIRFHIDTDKTVASMPVSSGKERMLIAGAPYSEGTSVPTGWALQTAGADL